MRPASAGLFFGTHLVLFEHTRFRKVRMRTYTFDNRVQLRPDIANGKQE